MGFGEFVDSMGEFILGGPDSGNLLDRTPEFFQKSLSAASLFGLKGDVADMTTALTGKDPLSGQNVTGVERWMGVLGVGALGGGVIGGARLADLGFPANTMLSQGRRTSDIGHVEFELTPGKRVTKRTGALDAALARLNDEQGLTDPDLVYMTTRQQTNDILKLDLTYNLSGSYGAAIPGGPAFQAPRGMTGGYGQAAAQRNGWRKLAKAVSGEDNPAMAGYLEGLLAQRIMAETPSNAAYRARRFEDPDPFDDLKATSFLMAQWEMADAWEGFKFEGKTGPQALKEWHKLKAGDTNIDTELLLNAQAKFAVGIDWLQDPELRINPMVKLDHMNLDGPRAVVSLKALQWRQVSLDQLSGRAVQERMKALVEMHPSNMVLVFKDNLAQLMDQAMSKPPGVDWVDWSTDMRHVPTGLPGDDPTELIRGWRDWYSQARKDLAAEAAALRQKFSGPTGDQRANLESHVRAAAGSTDPEVQRRGRKAKKLLSGGSGSRHFASDDQAAKWLTVVASLTSAAEDWKTNVSKAVSVADYLHGPKRAKTVAAMHDDINSLIGVKVPQSDLIKILLLEGVDDPLDIFRNGRAGTKADPGMTGAEIAAAIDEGQDLSYLAGERILPSSWASQKQDSFAYAILMSRKAELEERAHYLSEMMAGELGSVYEYTPGGRGRIAAGEAPKPSEMKVMTGNTAREKLPVVADRQHFKASIGFSLVPDTWYASAPGSYDQFAQAARVLAAEIGQIDGRAVLPEEVQAITWMRYRAMSHFTDPLGRNWALNPKGVKGKLQRLRSPTSGSGKDKITKTADKLARDMKKADEIEAEYNKFGTVGGEEVLDYDKADLGQTVGWRNQGTKNATWRDGHGPELMFSNQVLKYLSGESVAPLPSARYVDAETDVTRYRANPNDLGWEEGTVTKADYEQVDFEVAADGSVKWLIEDGLMPRRGRYISSAKSNGKAVLRRVFARPVKDADVEFRRIHESTYELSDPNRPTGTGAIMHSDPNSREKLPFYQEGPMMSITAMSKFDDADGTNVLLRGQAGGSGQTASHVHARMLAELRKRGINVTVEDLSSHEGMSTAWDLGDGNMTWDHDAARRVLGKNYMQKGVTDVEGRRERIFRFETTDDLHRAARFLSSTASDHPALTHATRYMETYRPQEPFRRPDPIRFSEARERAALDWGQEEAADWYNGLSRVSDDPEVIASYEALRAQTVEMYRYLVEEMGIRFDFVSEDPYPTPAAMFDDLQRHGRMKVLKTQQGEHPFFTPEESDMFRAVHDYFGHAVHESDFGRFGQEVAATTHMQMYSADAQGAAFTEMRARTASQFEGGGKLAEHRMGLPPEEVLRWYRESFADWADDTWVRRIYRDEIADVRFYVDHETEAPPGTSGFWEHHYTDDQGRELININSAGGPHRSNVGQVWILDNDLGGFLANQRSGRLDPGGVGDHIFVDNVYDNRLLWMLDDGQEIHGNGKNIWGTTINTPEHLVDPTVATAQVPNNRSKMMSQHVTEFYVAIPLPETGAMPMAAVTRRQLDAPDARIVKVRKGSAQVRKSSASGRAKRTAFVVELPDMGNGEVDPMLWDDVRELLVESNDITAGIVVPSARAEVET